MGRIPQGRSDLRTELTQYNTSERTVHVPQTMDAGFGKPRAGQSSVKPEGHEWSTWDAEVATTMTCRPQRQQHGAPAG